MRFSNTVAPSVALASELVNDATHSTGHPLDEGVRAFADRRFGHDFSRVRVHTDERADQSARALTATAYTVGDHVVFSRGSYSPATASGRALLMHELTHVAQQAAAPSGSSALAVDPSAQAENEASLNETAALAAAPHSVTATSPALQRKLAIDNPSNLIPNPTGKGLKQTNAATVADYLSKLCSAGAPKVDAKNGQVTIDSSFCTAPAKAPGPVIGPPAPTAATSGTPVGCGCICDLVASTNSWKIQVDDSQWPHTNFDDEDGALGKKPGGTGGTVTAPSPNSPKLWGAGTASGKELDIDPWLVLGHELCGHGWLGNSGKHAGDVASNRGEGGHQDTVARENELRKEHGIDLRGTFKDPNCGESYYRDKSAPGKVNWSSFRAVCENWRKSYNAAHGTSYKITDKIP